MSDPQADTVIRLSALKKSFGTNTVLDDVQFTLARGENLVVLGKSGVGKSVLIKCMVRLIEPDSGHMDILGYDVCSLDEENELNSFRRKVGFLFQGGALYDSMTVGNNLKFPLERSPHREDREDMEDKIHEVLKSVGLESSIDKMPAELSGGMKKRIALARSLILRPEIMLYDEPTTGLDPVTAREISHLLLEMQEKYNISSIIITHDIACAEITSNRMAIIRDGRFKAEGTFEELTQSDENWVRAFFK